MPVVTCIALRNPALIAKGALTVDQISSGQFEAFERIARAANHPERVLATFVIRAVS